MDDASVDVKNIKIDWNSLGNFSWTDWNEDISHHRKKRIRRKKGPQGAGNTVLAIKNTTIYYVRIIKYCYRISKYGMTFNLLDEFLYPPEEYEGLPNSAKSSSRTFSLVTDETWVYPIADEDKFTGNCFPGRCWGVPYEFDPAFNVQDRKRIKEAMDEIELDTCIRYNIKVIFVFECS